MAKTENWSSKRTPAGGKTSQQQASYAHRHPNEEPYSSGESCDEPEPPNPCAPESKRDDCNCPKTPGSQATPKKPDRPKPRRDDCCEQLIELLRGVPGLELPKPRKPKQRPARKAQDLCDAFGISDAILPALALLWERHKGGEAGRNSFEDAIQSIYASLDEAGEKAMAAAFKSYAELRRSGKGECLFRDCLSDAGRKGPIERSWFAEELLREGLKLAGMVAFRGSGGEIGPGQVRLWDNKVFHGPNGSGVTVFQGPWPWLTALSTNHTSAEEFGNVESFRPIPGGFHLWQNWQYAQTCEFIPDSSGKINASCQREHPAPASPGSLSPNFCTGGEKYTHNNDCIRIPAQLAGGSLKLRGFNFITPTVKVRFTLTSNPSVTFEEECAVWGDRQTPLKDEKDHYIVDERVNDWVDVPIRRDHPTQPGGKLPPGIYAIKVIVANVTNANYDGSAPPVLVTNELLLRIEADPSTKFLMWSERGRCNRETPGMGDDEIWWDAFVGHLVPSAVPVPPTGSSPLELRPIDRRSFPRAAWEDMDDGESAGAYKQDVWGPAAFELYGVAAIAMIGFEVDSEAEARNQTRSFGEAFGRAMESVAAAALAGEGLAATIAKLAGLTLTGALIILAVIAAIVLISVVFWAAWAPADLIALDLMVLDALSVWDRTDPDKPLPPDAGRLFEDDIGGGGVAAQGSALITVTERALPKIYKPGDAAATWVQENTYDTPEHAEDASYTLEFRLARS